ncbi:MAG: hypothetical protein ACKVHR_16035 [Pirellulales bacterium]
MELPTHTPIRIIKLGGSLLDMPDLTPRLDFWLSQQSPMLNLCIVGGGKSVQKLRDLKSSVDSPVTHWKCIRLMDKNANLLSRTSRDWIFIDSLKLLPLDSSTSFIFFGTEDWLRNSITCLPESWSVTSDSIAVVLARFVTAKELILLKSALPPVEKNLTQLMETEFVDRHFKTAATLVNNSDQLSPCGRIDCVNFRDNNFPQQPLILGSDSQD